MKNSRKLREILFPKINLHHLLKTVSVCLIIIAGFCFTSCSGSDSGATLGDLKNDLNFPNQVEKELPVPAKSTFKSHFKSKGNHLAMVSFETPYPETVASIAERLEEHGWEIYDEYISDDEEGEREATWNIRGYDLEGTVTLTAFGDRDGTMKSAEYFIKGSK